MKRIALLLFAFLALPYFARAQTAQLYYAFTAVATGGVADTSLAPQVDALNVRISGIGTSSSWTAQIQTSPDNATWSNCGSVVTATSAASASGGACTPSGAAFTRVLITAGSGGGSVVGALMGTCSLCQVASSGGITLTTTGTSGAATLVAGVLNIPVYSIALPTSNAIGDTLFATAASSTTYVARTTSKIPVELYGATPYASEAAAAAGPDDTADFQAAVTGSVGGVASCQAGKFYHVDGPINFISYEGLIGSSNQTYTGHCNLVSNSATTHILSAVGSSGTNVIGVTLANLTIDRETAGTGTSSGVYSSFTGGMIVTNVLSYDSIYDFYRHASPGFGIGYWSYDQGGWRDSETTGTYYGVYDDSADGNAENSIILDHTSTSCTGLSGAAVGYGQILIGTAVNDNRTDDFNTNTCTFGQVVDYTGAGASVSGQDIHFAHSTHDTVGTAFLVENLPQSSRATVAITDAWMSGTGSTSELVDCEASYGLVVANSMIMGPSNTAIYLHTCDSAVVSGNTISSDANGGGNLSNIVILNGSTHTAVTGNKIAGLSGTGGNLVWLTGNSTYNTVTGNALSGFSSAGNGIGIDAGSNNNTYSGNGIDTTSITSGHTIVDSATGGGQFIPELNSYNLTVTAAASSVPIIKYFAPNATNGASCQAYEQFGVAATTNNGAQQVFHCVALGGASNWLGWDIIGATSYSLSIWPNASGEFGETTPAAGPANGLAVGTTGQFQVSGAGAVTTPSYSTSGATFTASGCSNGTLVGGATAGSFDSGTTGTCTVTVTMGASQAAAHGWACSVHDLTTPADTINETPGSTTTAVFTGTTVTGDVIAFGCMGY